MINPRYKKPQLYTIKTNDLALSSPALVELMQAVLEKGLSFRFRAKGWSMAPFIRDGDIVTVSPLKSAPLRVGDVYAFVYPEMRNLVVHRAVAKFEKGLLFQGDNSHGKNDGVVPFKFLLGRVIQIERNDHRVSLGLGFERYLIVLLSRLGFLTPIYFWLASRRKDFSRREKK